MFFNTENPYVEFAVIALAVVVADLISAYLVANAGWYPKKKAA